MSDTDFEKYSKRCNWCSSYVKLVPDKPYCFDCKSKCVRECIRCHRPLNSLKFFKKFNNEKRCDTCMNKYNKELAKKENKSEEQINMSDEERVHSEEEEEEQVKKVEENSSEDEINKKSCDNLIKKNKKRPLEKDLLSSDEEESNKKNKKPKIPKKKVEKKPRKTKKKEITAQNIIEEWMSDRESIKSYLATKRIGIIPIFI